MLEHAFKIYSGLIKYVRGNLFISKIIFGYKPINNSYGEIWDWTTIELVKGINKYFRKGSTFLDVGTGPYGVLAFYTKIRMKSENITGCDHIEELILNAKKQFPNSGIEFIVSDLFCSMNKEYDFIVFNAPYMEEKFGSKIGVIKDELSKKRWSGGEFGLETIKKFLKTLPDSLSAGGTCLLGVNNFYIKHDKILKHIQKNTCLELFNYKKNMLTQAAVYVLKRKTYEM